MTTFNIPPKFNNLIRSEAAITFERALLTAHYMESTPSDVPADEMRDISECASRLSKYYLRREPTPRERDLAVRGMLVGRVLGRALLRAQYAEVASDEISTLPDQVQFNLDVVEEVYKTFDNSEDRNILADTVAAGLLNTKDEPVGLARLAVGLQILRYENVSNAYINKHISAGYLAQDVDDIYAKLQEQEDGLGFDDDTD